MSSELEDRVRVGEALPALMTDADLMRVVCLKRARFQQLKKEGRFDFLMARPVLNTTRYSGPKVQAWIDGAGTPQTQHGLRRLKLARSR